ncbi:MAG: hypothetical protein IPM20_02085 [Gammaproteobacteria bacterium]|nr:hypothetical protein [Gammaproteobacteria bacterium]
MTKIISRSLVSALLICVTLFCFADHEDRDDRKSDRATYLIPSEFDPEPGPWLKAEDGKKYRKVTATEFSIMLRETLLAEAIPEFKVQLHGVVQDTMSIITVYDPSQHDLWITPSQVRADFDDLWHFRGRHKFACVGEELDEYTGYYRYHYYCDPQPSMNSDFALLSVAPDGTKSRPSREKLYMGGCAFKKNYLRPEDGSHHQWCRFSRKTPWGDHFTYNLRSENIRLHEEVEAYIQSLLSDWRVKPTE